MAYQAQRAKRFQEDFELVNESGEIVETLHVNLDADDMVVKLNRKYVDLTKAMAETNELKRQAKNNEEMEQAFEKLGFAINAMLEAVFGIEDAQKIIKFYDGRYIEMTKEVLPFITQIVIPQCIQIKNENRKSILDSYNRKQRRAMLKKVK